MERRRLFRNISNDLKSKSAEVNEKQTKINQLQQYVSFLQSNNLILHNKLNESLKTSEILSNKIQETTEENTQLQKISDKTSEYNIVCENILSYSKKLNQQQKKIFFQIVSKNVVNQVKFIKKFGISKSTAYTYVAEKSFASNAKKNEKKEQLTTFINEYLPIQSGRNFRLCQKPRIYLFSDYKKYCTNSYVFSTFLSKISKENIHFSCYSPCLICESTNKTLVEFHNALSSHQRNNYIYSKKNIFDDDLFITIDFTQLIFDEMRQDLIISHYTKKNNLQFKHFIANSRTPNDYSFVMHVFDFYIRKLITKNNYKKMIIWSDGCRKHFKSSIMMVFFWNFQSSLNCAVEWNFFCSNHGHNSCDLAASQIKRKLKSEICIKRKELNLEAIVSSTNEIDHHKAKSIESKINKFKTPTMVGISNYHQFVFGNEGVVGFLRYPRGTDPNGISLVIGKKKEKMLKEKFVWELSPHNNAMNSLINEYFTPFDVEIDV